MRVTRCFLLIAMLSIAGTRLYGQEFLDVKVEPPTVDFVQLTAQQSVKNIKKLVQTGNFDKYKKGSQDTLTLEYFDKKGNKINSVSFSRGQRTGSVNFETLNNNTLWRWQSVDFNDKNKTSISRTFRDAKGKNLSLHNRDVVKGDTVSYGDALFTYNAAGQLIKREDFRAGKLVLRKTFEYKGQDMVLAQVRSNFDPQDFHQEYRYTYNANHQPVEKRYALIRFGKPDPAEISYFTYQAGNLTNQRYPDSSVPGKYINIDYTYDAQNRVSEIMAKKDTLYRHITYQYDGNRIVKINAETNSWLNFSKELSIFNLSSRTPIPIKFERQYAYDSHGHVLKITEAINGEPLVERNYTIEYYE